MTFKEYCKPLRGLPVNQIATEDVLTVLRPIWQSTPETANRVRGRIERVLDAAKAKGYRTGDNPARWRGHLDNLLPKQQRLTRGHHAAMPFGEVPAFIAGLLARPTVAGLALEFLILTATRTAETIGADWEEIDIASKVWTIPATRMKAGRRTLFLCRAGRSKFCARRKGSVGKATSSPVRNPAGHFPTWPSSRCCIGWRSKTVTAHGFRSSFRRLVRRMHAIPARSGGGRASTRHPRQGGSSISGEPLRWRSGANSWMLGQRSVPPRFRTRSSNSDWCMHEVRRAPVAISFRLARMACAKGHQ